MHPLLGAAVGGTRFHRWVESRTTRPHDWNVHLNADRRSGLILSAQYALPQHIWISHSSNAAYASEHFGRSSQTRCTRPIRHKDLLALFERSILQNDQTCLSCVRWVG